MGVGMHCRVACAVAASLAGLLSLSQTVHAKPAIAVLRIDVVLTGGKTDAAATVVANKLTSAIRQATSERSPYQLAPNSNKDLLELKLLYNCSNEAPRCMAKIGQSLKATRLLWGKLAHKGDHYLVTVNLLNVPGRAMVRSTTERIPMDQANPAGLRRWGRTLYNRLTGQKDHGKLHIVANASSGVVLIDGNPATNLKDGQADIAGLSEGSHQLEIKADGFKPYSETIVVEGGKKTTVNANLEAKATQIVKPEIPEKPGKPGGFARAMFWTTAATTIAGAVGFTVTGMQVRGSLKDKQTEEIINLRTLTGIELNATNACADAEMRGPVAQNVVDACNAGKSRASLANIFLGVSVVSALAAGFFYWKGYASQGKSTSKESSDGSVSRVRINPSIGPGHVGAGISVEF